MNLHDKFSGKKILVTGHTGFKGAWLTAWLKQLGADVVGISTGAPTEPSHFEVAKLHQNITDLLLDIRNKDDLEDAVVSAQPDFVFHLAAQALVRESYNDPLATYQTNLMGTIHLLEALRSLKKECAVVIITSDKCYDNVEWIWGYRETDSLGGPDPYSASKGAAELAIHSYLKSYFPKDSSTIRIASARAGNVIGGGDWAQDRIVPDCVKAWSANSDVILRNPQATRPWQHVLEPLSGYLMLALALNSRPEIHGEPFNFGPQAQQNHSVLELVEEMSKHWKQVHWQVEEQKIQKHHESGLLKLNCDKALHYLHWHATMEFKDTVRMTADWYRDFYSKPETIADTTQSQIAAFTTIAREKGLPWAL